MNYQPSGKNKRGGSRGMLMSRERNSRKQPEDRGRGGDGQGAVGCQEKREGNILR